MTAACTQHHDGRPQFWLRTAILVLDCIKKLSAACSVDTVYVVSQIMSVFSILQGPHLFIIDSKGCQPSSFRSDSLETTEVELLTASEKNDSNIEALHLRLLPHSVPEV